MVHPVNRIELAKSGYGNCALKNLKSEKYKRFACPEGCGPGNEGPEGKAIAKVRGQKFKHCREGAPRRRSRLTRRTPPGPAPRRQPLPGDVHQAQLVAGENTRPRRERGTRTDLAHQSGATFLAGGQYAPQCREGARGLTQTSLKK